MPAIKGVFLKLIESVLLERIIGDITSFKSKGNNIIILDNLLEYLN